MPARAILPSAQTQDRNQAGDRRETGRLLRLMKLLYSMCDDDRFNAEDIGLMVALSRYTNAEATCFPSQSLLADKLGKSRPWVNAHLAMLCDRGVLSKTRRKYASNGEMACLYGIIFDLAVVSEKVSSSVERDSASVTTLRRPAMRRHSAPDTDGFACPPADTVCQDPDTLCQGADTNLFNSKPSEHEQEGRRDWKPIASPPPDPTVALPVRHDDGKGEGATVVDIETATLAKRLQRSSTKPWKLATASKAVEEAVARAGIDAVRRMAEKDLIGAGLPPWEIAARLETMRSPKAMTGTERQPEARGTIAGSDPSSASTPQIATPERDSREANQPLASLSRTPKSAADLQVERLAVRYIDQLDPITRNVVWFNRARTAGCPSNRSHDTASWAPWVAYQFLEENHHRALAKIVAESVVS